MITWAVSRMSSLCVLGLLSCWYLNVAFLFGERWMWCGITRVLYNCWLPTVALSPVEVLTPLWNNTLFLIWEASRSCKNNLISFFCFRFWFILLNIRFSSSSQTDREKDWVVSQTEIKKIQENSNIRTICSFFLFSFIPCTMNMSIDINESNKNFISMRIFNSTACEHKILRRELFLLASLMFVHSVLCITSSYALQLSFRACREPLNAETIG